MSDTSSAPRGQESAAAARIRRAAIEVFAESGYGGTSTRTITGHLGMSATAIYPHYRSKEELLFAIAREGHQGVLDVMRAADDALTADGAATWTARLRAVVAAFAQWQARESKLARVVQYEIRSLSREHLVEVVAIREETADLITALITGGVYAGEFGVEHPDDAVLAILSLCVDICRWFPYRGYRDPVEVGEVYARLAVSLVEPTGRSGPVAE